MDDYLELLILAYFKQSRSYSISSITSMLGTSLRKTSDLIDGLLEKKYLIYTDGLLQLSDVGRLQIQNHDVDYLHFDSDEFRVPKVNPSEAWPKDRIYIPEKFLCKL